MLSDLIIALHVCGCTLICVCTWVCASMLILWLCANAYYPSYCVYPDGVYFCNYEFNSAPLGAKRDILKVFFFVIFFKK